MGSQTYETFVSVINPDNTASMDNEASVWSVFHRFGFAEAIELELLTD